MDYQTLLHSLSRPRGDASAGRLVAVRRSGAFLYIAAGDPAVFRKVPVESPAAVAQAIRELSAIPAGAPQAPRWVMCVPGHLAIVRLLELPSTSIDELRAMARLQALPGLPFPEEELVCDTAIVQTDTAAKVMTAIARKSQIQELLSFCAGPSEWPDGFVLNSVALRTYVSRRLKPPPDPYLHLDFCDGWATLDVVAQGRLQHTRAVPVQGREQDISKLTGECRQTLTMSGATGVKKAFVSGHSPEMAPRVQAALEKELGCAVDILSFEGAPGEARDIPISTLGAAWSLPADTLHLAPSEVTRARASKKTTDEWSITFTWLGILILALVLVTGWTIARKTVALASLDSQLRKLEPLAQKASLASDYAAVMQDLSVRRPLPLEYIKELYDRAPASLGLRTFSYQPEGNFSIQGRCHQLSSVVTYVNSLQASPLFSRVELLGSSLHTVQNAERVDFQIEGTLAVHPTEFAHE